MPQRNILVADDEDVVRDFLASRLREQGFLVSTAGDGEEAIALLGRGNFDLVLLDLTMPKVDGYGVLQFVRQNNLSTKIIMLTGYSELKNAIHSKKLGAEDFISKPFDFKDLLTTIDRVIGDV
jgi:DNA-binding response OmpR family regulator